VPPSSTMEPAASGLAPRWHTAALVFLILAVAVTGTVLGRGAPGAVLSPGARAKLVYLPLLLVEWSLVAYVCRIGRASNALGVLLGAGWRSARGAILDVALAAAGWFVIEASEAAFGRFATASNVAVVTMLPHSGVERALWGLVAGSAGFCEEVVYRGYMQTQLTAFTGRVSLGFALLAFLFGIAHGEQGLAIVIRFALYGVGFGVIARWRGSLVPGILCHVGVDLAGGLLAR
jgi:membrane protease YdiL (CAAX protease family)